jgi:hypothetical protein
MATQFEKKNYCAVALGLIVFALTIAGTVVNWYFHHDVYNRSTVSSAQFSSDSPGSVVDTTELNFTKVNYDLSGFTVESKLSSGVIDSTFNEYSGRSGSDVLDVFNTTQAFVIISLVLSFVISLLLTLFLFGQLRNKFIFTFGMTFTRVFVVVMVLLLVISLTIAFLVFLGITEAFENEVQSCTEGPCRKFVDSVKTDGLSDVDNSVTYTLIRTQSWGPSAGWYVNLAAVPISVFLLIFVVINMFPLPIDSETSSGEAL